MIDIVGGLSQDAYDDMVTFIDLFNASVAIKALDVTRIEEEDLQRLLDILGDKIIEYKKYQEEGD